MTTPQPNAQPSLASSLAELATDAHNLYMRLNGIMDAIPRDGEDLNEAWYDCHRPAQALYLACQLIEVARDNERARNEPVPYLPASVLEQTTRLIAAAIESGSPVIVTDAQ